MKKYVETFRISFKMQIVWRFDVAVTMVATIARIITAWILWGAIFEGAGSVSGFTFEGMLSYYVVCSIISSIDFSKHVSSEVSWLIRDGGFSKHMVTPMNPMGFFGSMSGGQSAFHLGFSLLAAMICAALFRINVILTADAVQVVLAAAIILIGLIFMVAYQYFIGIMAFKFMDVSFFMHVQESILAFATGALIPLSLLPGAVVGVLRVLPFTHVVYTPTMLLTGQMDTIEGVFSLGVISIWTMAMLIVSQRTYRRFRMKYDGVGI